MLPRVVLHLNTADFAVACERLADCQYRDRPVIVAPAGSARALVYDHCDLAYQAGVRKAMPLGQAQRLMRDAVVVSPNPELYGRGIAAMVRRASAFSPRVEEAVGDGHLYLDLTGTARLLGPYRDTAWRLRREIKATLGLDPIWTLAPNKLLAKVASRLVKPTGELIVEPGQEADLLQPLPLVLLPGVEAPVIRRLREFGVRRVGEAALLSPSQLETALGQPASALYDALRGRDESPVLALGGKPPTVEQRHEFGEDTNTDAAVEAALYRMVERSCYELRCRHLAASRVTVTADYSDGTRAAKSRTGFPTANDFNLFERCKSALASAWTRRVRLRRLSLVCDQLVHPATQLKLFAEEDRTEQRQQRMLGTLDRIRERFGVEAIQSGRAWVPTES